MRPVVVAVARHPVERGEGEEDDRRDKRVHDDAEDSGNEVERDPDESARTLVDVVAREVGVTGQVGEEDQPRGAQQGPDERIQRHRDLLVREIPRPRRLRDHGCGPWDECERCEDPEVGPLQTAIHLPDPREGGLVVQPDDGEIDIGAGVRQIGRPLLEEGGQQLALLGSGWSEVEHEQRDDDGDDRIAERDRPAGVRTPRAGHGGSPRAPAVRPHRRRSRTRRVTPPARCDPGAARPSSNRRPGCRSARTPAAPRRGPDRG